MDSQNQNDFYRLPQQSINPSSPPDRRHSVCSVEVTSDHPEVEMSSRKATSSNMNAGAGDHISSARISSPALVEETK